MNLAKGLFNSTMLGAALVLSACGDDAENAVNNALNEADLNGRFESQCTESGMPGFQMIEGYRFNADGTFSRYRDFYTSQDCSDTEKAGVFEVVGGYRVDNDGAPQSAGGAIEFDLETATVTLSTEAMADAANLANFCGVDSYEAGVTANVSGGSDDLLCPVQDVPGQVFGVYSESDGQLVLNEGGLSEMGVSAEERPVELDQETIFFKQ